MRCTISYILMWNMNKRGNEANSCTNYANGIMSASHPPGGDAVINVTPEILSIR